MSTQVPGRLCLLPLRRHGQVVAHAIVDASDYEALCVFRWYLDKDGYAVKSVRLDGQTRTIGLHRDVLGLTRGDGLVADHINRDKLDNRRCNLRALTKEQSAQNRGARVRSRSRFRGVNYVPTTGRWIARVRIGNPGRLHNLGTFETEDEAAEAAVAFRSEHMPYSVEGVAA